MVIGNMVHFRCTNKSLDTERRWPSGALGAGPGYPMDAGRVQAHLTQFCASLLKFLHLEAFGPDGQYPMRGNSERHALAETQRIPADWAFGRPGPQLLVHSELASPVRCPHVTGSAVTTPRLRGDGATPGQSLSAPDGRSEQGDLRLYDSIQGNNQPVGPREWARRISQPPARCER